MTQEFIEMLEAVKKDLEVVFQAGYKKDEVHLLAASSAGKEETLVWLEEIHAYFPDMEILSDTLSLGISCHTGEGALGIGFSCKPVRQK